MIPQPSQHRHPSAEGCEGQPVRARANSSASELMLSLRKIALRWSLTVWRLMSSSKAMASDEQPASNSEHISC